MVRRSSDEPVLLVALQLLKPAEDCAAAKVRQGDEAER
jgi:hypothetical protein